MNNKEARYEMHEISGAGFVIWDNNKCGPITGCYAMSEGQARNMCDAFNKQEQEKRERTIRLAKGVA